MAESNSQPTRCPCGYIGSAQTLGLCSKCYRDREQNRDQITAEASRSSTVSMEMRKEKESSKFPEDLRDDATTPKTYGATNTESENELTEATSTKAVVAEDVEDADAGSSSSSSINDASNNERRGKKRKRDEMDDEDDEATDEHLVQKNKKRCFDCNCRMDLAIREIGKCRCEYIFCSLHRLPEQHSCTFDHKEFNRQEARTKMVVFKKHIGTALKRLDYDDS